MVNNGLQTTLLVLFQILLPHNPKRIGRCLDVRDVGGSILHERFPQIEAFADGGHTNEHVVHGAAGIGIAGWLKIQPLEQTEMSAGTGLH